ncbi:unnamed protein product [Echinostoma caproni]|uniref:Spectrin repeat-containing domain protein n=1 Tax=Echinostoma caproni TaxID=27848 RepID=A0A183AW98_9TREM|nr:unnamed protein product [Echinostoma caproni]
MLDEAFPAIRPRTHGSLQPLDESPSSPKSQPELAPDELVTRDPIGREQFRVRRDSQISGLRFRFETIQHEIEQHGTSRIDSMKQVDTNIATALAELSTQHQSLITWITRRLSQQHADDDEMVDDVRDTRMDIGKQIDWDERSTCSDSSFVPEGIDQSSSDNRCTFVLTKRMNASWSMLKDICDARATRFELIDAIDRFYHTIECTNEWIVRNYRLLLSTDDLGADLNSLIQLQRKLLGWESDMVALGQRMQEIGDEVQRLIHELQDQAPTRRDLYLASDELRTVSEIRQLGERLVDQWNELEHALQDRQEKLLVSAELQQFLQASHVCAFFSSFLRKSV